MVAIPVKCPFCKQEAEFNHREALFEYDVWKCNHCPNDVQMSAHDTDIFGVSMVASVNYNSYLIDMWYSQNESNNADGMDVSTISTNGDIITVFELPFRPDWNPANIQSKLKKVLTFL